MYVACNTFLRTAHSLTLTYLLVSRGFTRCCTGAFGAVVAGTPDLP